jgi:hypothetical protein
MGTSFARLFISGAEVRQKIVALADLWRQLETAAMQRQSELGIGSAFTNQRKHNAVVMLPL